MKKIIVKFKKFFLERFLLFFLLPFVIYIYLQNFGQINSKGVETYAVNPISITYNGSNPPDPMFSLNNMLPGDYHEKVFKVKNNSDQPLSVLMKSIKKDEEKNFSEILEIEIIRESLSDTIFNGTLKDFFDLLTFNLGVFPPGSEESFKVSIKFPETADNKYQNANLIFDIIWTSEIPPIEIPKECNKLLGKIKNVIKGTDANDVIRGTSESNLIIAQGGDDKIDSGGGDDCILAGDGNDKIKSRAGNDLVYGQAGNDEIDGGSGIDEIFGGSGDDILMAGSGNDKVFGEDGNDSIYAGSGDDFLNGGLGIDNLFGNSGFDTCIDAELYSSCEL